MLGRSSPQGAALVWVDAAAGMRRSRRVLHDCDCVILCSPMCHSSLFHFHFALLLCLSVCLPIHALVRMNNPCTCVCLCVCATRLVLCAHCGNAGVHTIAPLSPSLLAPITFMADATACAAARRQRHKGMTRLLTTRPCLAWSVEGRPSHSRRFSPPISRRRCERRCVLYSVVYRRVN